MPEGHLNFCVNGILDITREGKAYNCRFPNSDFPSLEAELIKAGFTKEQREKLTPLLNTVGTIYKAWEFPVLENRLMDNAFNLSMASDESVIIDMVPLKKPEDTEKMIENFNKRTQEYKQQHGEESIQSFVVLAYCPPAELSKRIQGRNEKAERSGQLGDKRVGMFPFVHLHGVVQARPYPLKENEVSLGHVSRSRMREISLQHEQHLDPKTKFEQAVKSGDRLAQGFGMKDNQKIAFLVVPEGMKVDKVIDTSVGTPDELAQKVLAVTGSEKQTNRPKQ